MRTLTWIPREPEVFGQPDEPHRLERFLRDHRHVADLRPADARHGVQVHPQLVGVVQVVRANGMRIEVEAAEVHHPGETRRVVDDDLVGRPAGRERQGDRAQPLGPVVRRALLEERLARGAVHEALERHRPAAGAGQGARGHGEVVADEVQLGRPDRLEEDLARVGDHDLAITDAEDLLLLRHARMLACCRFPDGPFVDPAIAARCRDTPGGPRCGT